MLNMDDLFNLGARIERVIWIPGATCSDSPPSDFREFFEDFDDDNKGMVALAETLPVIKRFLAIDDDCEDDEGDMMEALAGTPGFLVQAASPCRTYRAGDTINSYYSSWGNYYTVWLYVESMEQLMEPLEKWVDERAAADKAYAENAGK